jgi:chemotaxis protein methyltransferase CheR
MDFTDFRNQVNKSFGLDLNSYKENQLKRRLDSFLVRNKIVNYGDFFRIISSSRDEYIKFLDYLTINVSEFFRDLKMFQILETQVIPELLARIGKLNVWSAACSIGAEPYSVAMILNELSPNKLHRIDATDLDQSIIEKAKHGRYTADVLKNVNPQRLNKYFAKENDKFYLINQQIRNMVSYKQHDLLSTQYPKGYDLILCRNVTIYFTREAQEKVNRQFSQSLNPGGYLFIGGSETIFNYADFGLIKTSPCFYKKKG